MYNKQNLRAILFIFAVAGSIKSYVEILEVISSDSVVSLVCLSECLCAVFPLVHMFSSSNRASVWCTLRRQSFAFTRSATDSQPSRIIQLACFGRPHGRIEWSCLEIITGRIMIGPSIN